MKYFLIILIFFLYSCDEDEITKVDDNPKDDEIEDVEDEEPTDSNYVTKHFLVEYDLYPEYTFWGHGIKLTLELNDSLDISKLKYFFNGYEINSYESNKTPTQFIQLFEIPLDAYSDSIEIRQYFDKDSSIFYTRKLEIVNSEIEIYNASPGCANNSTITGKGLRYAKYLKIVFQNNYGMEFQANYYYNNNASGTSGSPGVTINDGLAKYNFANALSYGFKIEAYDSIKMVRHPYPQLHSYPYIYKSQGMANVENPKVKRILVQGYSVEVEVESWYSLKADDIIRLNDKTLNNSDLSFTRAFQYWYAGSLDISNAKLKFFNDQTAEKNKLEIKLSCAKDTVVFFEQGVEFKSAMIYADLGTAFYKIDEKSRTGEDFNEYLTFTADGLKSDFKFPKSYAIYSTESRNGFSGNYLKNLTLKYLNDNSISFVYTISNNEYYSSNHQGSNEDNLTISYEGTCNVDDLGSTIVVRIERNQLEELSVNRNLYSSFAHGGSISDNYIAYLERIDYSNDAFIELVFQKW